MRISVKIKPNSKIAKVERVENIYKVSVNAPAQDGKANKALIEIVAKHFEVSKNQVTIISGHSSKSKIIEIRD